MSLTSPVPMVLKMSFTACGLVLRWAATKTIMDLRERKLAVKKYSLGRSLGLPRTTTAGATRSCPFHLLSRIKSLASIFVVSGEVYPSSKCSESILRRENAPKERLLARRIPLMTTQCVTRIRNFALLHWSNLRGKSLPSAKYKWIKANTYWSSQMTTVWSGVRMKTPILLRLRL